MPDETKPISIRNRESWLKVGVIALFSVVICVKIAWVPFTVDLKDFNFTDLLNLLLALFAIAMSIAFYFKATDTSNRFYDNSYRFTKDISEILGRMEAGFGERLRHLDEGYAGLRQSVERIPTDPAKAQQAVLEEEEEVRRREEERNKLLEELAAKAKLEDKEKKELFSRLRQQDSELAEARRELEFFRNRLADVERGRPSQSFDNLEPKRMVEALRGHVIEKLGGRTAVRELPVDAVIKRYNSMFRSELDRGDAFTEDCRKAGIVDDNGGLTTFGAEVLIHLACS